MQPLTTFVFGLGEGGELKHYRLLNAQQYKLSASVDKSDSAPLLPMQCYGQCFLWKRIFLSHKWNK